MKIASSPRSPLHTESLSFFIEIKLSKYLMEKGNNNVAFVSKDNKFFIIDRMELTKDWYNIYLKFYKEEVDEFSSKYYFYFYNEDYFYLVIKWLEEWESLITLDNSGIIVNFVHYKERLHFTGVV